MKLILILVLISVYLLAHSSSVLNVKDNIVYLLRRSIDHPESNKIIFDYKKEKKKDVLDVETAQSKSKFVKQLKNKQNDKTSRNKPRHHSKIKYVKDPVLNMVGNGRRKYIDKLPLSFSESSSLEMEDWKDEWREHLLEKKFEAINYTGPRGDTVNMIGARPWGVPCGDPNQHDMPWGTCMFPMECEPEFRIYRGDYFCGRTQFICCALQVSSYDMYQGFDASFADSNLATDSDEKRHRDQGSKEKRRRKKIRQQRRRRRERDRRKRKLKRNIKKIVREIRKILNRSFRNSTTEKKKKTRQLKKFIDVLKKQYKKDRHSVKNIHMQKLKQIDIALQTKLDQIRGVHQQFLKNSTFRDIVVNGTVNPKVKRMLLEAYPELAGMINTRKTNLDYNQPVDYLNYDIEYGLLYY